MINRIKQPQTLALSAAIILAAIVLFVQTSNSLQCNVAHASITNPNDYCISIEVDITNNTGGTLTNYPIRFEITADSLINNQTLDSRGWGVFPTLDGSFASEVGLMAGDLNSDAAAWWTEIDSIADGETQTVELFMGNPELKRDQAMFFNGGTVVTLDGSDPNTYHDESQFDFWIYNTDDTARTETLLDQNPASNFSGAEISFQDVAGALTISAEGDGAGRCDLTWDASWSNKWTLVQIYFSDRIGSDLAIYIDGTVEALCNEGHGALSDSANDTEIGDGRYGHLSNVFLRDVRLCQWTGDGRLCIESATEWQVSFNANDLTENLSSSNPYQGTITEAHNSVATTYEIDADQTNIDVVVNNPSLTSLTVGAVVEPELLDQTGQVLPDDIFTPPAKVTGTFFYTWFVEPMEGLFTVDWLGPTIFIYAVGLSLAIGFGKLTDFQYGLVNLTIFGFPAGIYAANGWTPWPFVLIWIVLILSQYFGVTRLLKESF